MDIATQAEIILRDAQYDTWSWTAVTPTVTCFENAAIMGFLHVFASEKALLAEWESRQNATLARYAPALRLAGDKAWNIYSVFLTSDGGEQRVHAIDQIEENLSLTRKIARSAIQTANDLEFALLPLLSIKAVPTLGATNFEGRLRNQLTEVPAEVVAAFLGERPVAEVVKALGVDT